MCIQLGVVCDLLCLREITAIDRAHIMAFVAKRRKLYASGPAGADDPDVHAKENTQDGLAKMNESAALRPEGTMHFSRWRVAAKRRSHRKTVDTKGDAPRRGAASG